MHFQRLTLIIKTETHGDNDGAVDEDDKSYYSWDSDISFLENKDSLYNDLIVSRKGIRDGETFEEEMIYEFNGVEYTETKRRY